MGKVFAMKKMILAPLLVVVLLTAAFNFNAKADTVDTILLYLPNRIVDFVDIFSLNLGFGPKIKAEFRLTRAFSFGSGIGVSALMIKDYNRQYGFGLENGWDGYFTCIFAEDTERKPTTRLVKEYWYHESGIPNPGSDIYNVYTGARDYWEIGVDAALMVDFHFALHPIDIADFFTGLVCIDLKGDDFTAQDLEY